MSDLERPLPDHGTRSRYVKGCECFECAEANRIYAAERARRNAMNCPAPALAWDTVNLI